jgi:tetratricopeptide (TPR) repeat protein
MLLTGHSDTIQVENTDKSLESGYARLKPAEYLRQAKAHFRAGKHKDAFALLQQSVMHFPNEPVLLSYYGHLLSLVERRYRMGIETCLKALEKLQTKEDFDAEALYPVFYCNLGKAYAIAGKRKEALEALNKGLSYDRRNNDIIKEMRCMGMRSKKPPIPFLKRSNSLNIFIGVMLYNKQNASDAKKRVVAR